MPNTLTEAEYLALQKRARHRVMASPSFRHFQKAHDTHLHAVLEFEREDGEPICSLIQRGARLRFYRGHPNWSEWLRPTPGHRQPHLSVFVPNPSPTP